MATPTQVPARPHAFLAVLLALVLGLFGGLGGDAESGLQKADSGLSGASAERAAVDVSPASKPANEFGEKSESESESESEDSDWVELDAHLVELALDPAMGWIHRSKTPITSRSRLIVARLGARGPPVA